MVTLQGMPIPLMGIVLAQHCLHGAVRHSEDLASFTLEKPSLSGKSNNFYALLPVSLQNTGVLEGSAFPRMTEGQGLLAARVNWTNMQRPYTHSGTYKLQRIVGC